MGIGYNGPNSNNRLMVLPGGHFTWFFTYGYNDGNFFIRAIQKYMQYRYMYNFMHESDVFEFDKIGSR